MDSMPISSIGGVWSTEVWSLKLHHMFTRSPLPLICWVILHAFAHAPGRFTDVSIWDSF